MLCALQSSPELGAVVLGQRISYGPLLAYGLLQLTCSKDYLDSHVVGVADRLLHVPAVDDASQSAPLHTEVIKLVSSVVAEGGGPGVVVVFFKACGCNDKGVFEAEI